MDLPTRIYDLGLSPETLDTLSAMAMDPLWQPLATFIQIIPVSLILFFAFFKWHPEDRAAVIFCLIGGGLTTIVEPLVDFNGLLLFSQKNQWAMLSSFGMLTPWFILPCFVWYIGGQTLYALHVLKKGALLRDIWRMYILFFITNVCLEIPAIAIGIYAYYGPQPLEVFGLPLWYPVLNSLSPLVSAAVIYHFRAHFNGVKTGLIALVPPSCHIALNAGAGWPIWCALNNKSSYLVTWITGSLTVGMALLILWMLTQLLRKYLVDVQAQSR